MHYAGRISFSVLFSVLKKVFPTVFTLKIDNVETVTYISQCVSSDQTINELFGLFISCIIIKLACDI